MPITERTVVSTGTMTDPYDLGYGMTYSVTAGTQDGGAVYVESIGVASGENLTFSGNGVTTEAGKGGAIYNAGYLSLDTANFSGNTASKGGAVCNTGKLLMTGDITLSTSTDTVYNEGSLIWNFTGDQSAKVSNYQYVTNAVDDKGKPTGILGIWVDAAEQLGTYTLATGVLSDYATNPAKYAFSISTDGETFAGLTLNNKVYFNNRLYTLAVTDADTKLTLTVENGTAPGQRLVVEDGEWITIQEDTTYDFTDQPYYAGNGGIIEVQAGGTFSNNPTTTLQFIGGKSAGSDNPHDVGGCATYRSAGGAIYSEGYVKLVGGTFTNNRSSGEHSGGAIYSSGKLILDSALFSDNISEQRDAGAICIAVSDPEEGVYSAEIYNTTFSNNYAEDDGGAIRLQEGTMKLINVEFRENSCTVYGGAAIGIHNGTEAVIDQATFAKNVSANGGGAIINSSAELTITNSEFTGNKTNNGEGGAIKNGKTLNLDNVNFGDGTAEGQNTATNGGNAIYNTGTINLKGDVKLFSNETIYLASGSKLNWVISDTDDKHGYLSDYNLIDGTTTVDTLTIDAEDALKESYTLAGNASSASGQEFTITTADGTSKTISTDAGVTDSTYGLTYTLATVAGTSGYDLVLSVAKTAITITANDATKMYDGTALTEGGYTITEGALIAGDVLTVTMTDESTITKVGTEENVIGEYKVMRGSEDVTGYYNITTANGTLEVTVNDTPTTLTAASDSKMYDGSALTNYNYTWTGDLGTGDEFSDVLFSGSQTHAGFSANEITSYKVTNAAGEDVTFCYDSIQTEDGVLTVTKRDVTLTSASDEKVYDGTPLVNGTVTVSGSGWVDGEGAAYNVTGNQTEVGSSANTFTYTLNEGTIADNYDITTVEGTLTVTLLSPVRISNYNNTAKSDIVQVQNGLVYVMHDTASGYVQSAALNDIDSWTVTEFRRDLTGDGLADVQITKDAGDGTTWVAALRNDYLTDGTTTLNYQFIGAYNNELWSYLGSADTNGDGKAEVLMEQTELGSDQGIRHVAAWVTDGEGKWVDNEWVGGLSEDWSDVAGTADIDGNGTDNVILRRADGMIGYWSEAGTGDVVRIAESGQSVLISSGDFDGDKTDDLLFTNASGDFFTWSNIGGDLSNVRIGNLSDLGESWSFAGTGDYNGDGKDELLWCDGTNTAYSEANQENFSKLVQIA